MQRYLDDTISKDELEVFFHLLQEGSLDESLLEVVNNHTGMTIAPRVAAGNKVRRVGVKKKLFAAAAVVAIISTTVIYFLYNSSPVKMPIAKQEETANDIAPGGNRATLTLADGTVLLLDSVKTGRLADQGAATVLKVADGQLAYDAIEKQNEKPVYNTVTTPKGGQYAIVLPDGSKVWLNSISSVRFPTAFAGNERKVELTGEGYFEIAKNAGKPFRVMVNGTEVEVLGTHFNVNAYGDEGVKKITLLEGAVKIKEGNKESMLQPGQQAVIDPGINIQVAEGINTEKVIAWKNGLFQFEKEDIETIMRQVSRWYNVDVRYEGKVPGGFYATIQRNVPVSELLKLLSLTERVHFKINGTVITVSP